MWSVLGMERHKQTIPACVNYGGSSKETGDHWQGETLTAKQTSNLWVGPKDTGERGSLGVIYKSGSLCLAFLTIQRSVC